MMEVTSEQKKDPLGSWNWKDEDFFARGACHVLCAVFLREHVDTDFKATLILPLNKFRGRHVVAATSTVVFDWRGFTPREAFLAAYAEAYRSRYPDWNYSLVSLDDPLSGDFCAQYNHRRPDQFPHDPVPRAQSYLHLLLSAIPQV